MREREDDQYRKIGFPRTSPKITCLNSDSAVETIDAISSRRRLCRLKKRRTSMPKQSLRKRTMVTIYDKMVVRWQQLCY